MSAHYWWRPAEIKGPDRARPRNPASYWGIILVPIVQDIFSLADAPIVGTVDGEKIALSGVMGEAPFYFAREWYGQPDPDDELGRIRGSCTSVGMAHDVVVMAILALLKQVDRRIYIRSDADPAAWSYPVSIAASAGAKYHLDVAHPFVLQRRESTDYVLGAPGRWDRALVVRS